MCVRKGYIGCDVGGLACDLTVPLQGTSMARVRQHIFLCGVRVQMSSSKERVYMSTCVRVRASVQCAPTRALCNVHAHIRASALAVFSWGTITARGRKRVRMSSCVRACSSVLVCESLFFCARVWERMQKSSCARACTSVRCSPTSTSYIVPLGSCGNVCR